MKHVETIEKFIRTLLASDKIHALIVISPPGWAKSSTTDDALRILNIDHHAVGSYTTPLALFQTLCAHPAKTILLDDCAGIFNDTKAMALLKAATWPSAGIGNKRRVTWDSTSDRVEQSEVVFTGKLILLANTLPERREVESFLSRTFLYRITFTDEEVKALLLQAARVERYFQNTAMATAVAEFLVKDLGGAASQDLSLRTLHVGYEVAANNPDDWRELLGEGVRS